MSIVRVAPDISNPTHHISLSDGETEIGLIVSTNQGDANPLGISVSPTPRTAIKTTTGNQKFSDFEFPWTPVAQEDWSGGRGQQDIEPDMTKYADGSFVTTAFANYAVSGGMEQYTKGYGRNMNFILPGSLRFQTIIPGNNLFIGTSFVPSATYDVATISVIVRKVGNPDDGLVVSICSDGVGAPGAVLQAVTIDPEDFTDTLSQFTECTLASVQAITSGTTYWIEATTTNCTDDDHWEIGVRDCSTTISKISADESTWVLSTYDLYFMVKDADTETVSYLFFDYYYQQYMVKNTLGSAPTLWTCGDRGTADANTGALTTLIDATKSWVTNAWAGCVVKIINGLGIAEEDKYRTVVSNTATALTVDPAWTITQDTTTEYVITGATTWYEVPTTGLTASVTSVLSVNGLVYFAQGDAVNIRRGRWTSASNYEWADDGTNKAVHLTVVRDSTNGQEIWKSNNSTSAGSVAKATIVAWGTNLTFGTAITLTDSNGRINNIGEFVISSPTLFMFKEGSVYYLSASKPAELQLQEMHCMLNSRNCKTFIVNDVYLYFNWGQGIERYLDGTLDDIGMDRETGLPAIRQGVVSSMVSYPGKIFGAVDAGLTGYSSIFMRNLSGWHEIYRHPVLGKRIRHIWFQCLEGNTPDRLWISVGNMLIYLPFPSTSLDPSKDSNYIYRYEGYLETSYISAGMFDIYKLFNTLKIFGEGFSDSCYIKADYRLDTDEDWTEIEGTYTEANTEKSLGDEGVSGKRVQLRLRFYTEDTTKSLKLKAYALETISRIPLRYTLSCSFRVRENDILLDQSYETLLPTAKLEQLLYWAETLTPLTLRCVEKEFDNWKVFIDPQPIRSYMEKKEGYIAQLTAIQRKSNVLD